MQQLGERKDDHQGGDQPEVQAAPVWMVTMEPRDETVTMDGPSVLNLAAELAVVSALCAFLQERSLAFVGVDHA